MSPRARRLVITLAVVVAAVGIVLITVTAPGRRPAGGDRPADEQAAPATAEAGDEAPPEPAPPDQAPPDQAPPDQAPPDQAPPVRTAADQPPPDAEPASAGSPQPQSLEGLHALWVEADGEPAPLGSLNPLEALLYLEFDRAGAGIDRITLSKHWQRAAEEAQAAAHYRAVARGHRNPPPLPDGRHRYVLQTAQRLTGVLADGSVREVSVPLLAAHSISLNGEAVSLIREVEDDGKRWTLWAETAPGEFECTIVDADERPIARLSRRFVPDGYDVVVRQTVTNLTDAPLEASWRQYGPGELVRDRFSYLDARRLRFGYRPAPDQAPRLIVSRDGDLLISRKEALDRAEEAAETTDPRRETELLRLWPNETSRKEGYDLSWFASTNRYFALGVHPLPGEDAQPPDQALSLAPVVEEIRLQVAGTAGGDEESKSVLTFFYAAPRTVGAGASVSLDFGAYAGPLDREILGTRQPMATLQMRALILYQMSAWCAICTFQWLAVALLKFLSAVHFLVADWGLAIILLVVVVRTVLHPLTKKAQVNMQRFGKAMGELKPEIDRLQKKFPNDPKKLQQEQIRLMRERGVNPFQMLGCLPMFLQMPIWVALYAMLYFAFELRHQPAFWGVFQQFWGWPFLADLSAADHFFWEFDEPTRFLLFNLSGINLLPVLMGVVFFMQQKYMSPPPSPTMSKEQIQQQKIMKVMMVVLFPVMLYSAPSGLTLYIFTSSLIGIVESRYIRRHISEMELAPPKPKAEPRQKKRKPRDLQGRMYADALERAKKKRQPPPKRYKKRR